MAKKPSENLNVVHEEGTPSNRMASPMTTGFSPAQRGTLDKVRNLNEPEDTLGLVTPRRKK